MLSASVVRLYVVCVCAVVLACCLWLAAVAAVAAGMRENLAFPLHDARSRDAGRFVQFVRRLQQQQQQHQWQQYARGIRRWYCLFVGLRACAQHQRHQFILIERTARTAVQSRRRGLHNRTLHRVSGVCWRTLN